MSQVNDNQQSMLAQKKKHEIVSTKDFFFWVHINIIRWH